MKWRALSAWPELQVSGTAPPPLPRQAHCWNPFTYLYGWVSHVVAISDTQLVATAGLDALVFLR